MIDGSFVQQVNDAFKQCSSRLALSRSPLVRTQAVQATLVLDDLSPTPEDLGRGLSIVLQWACEQLAPATPRYPIGQMRPLDDPTWRDPLWWRYNILRHRYLEPLHPDDFVEGGRFTDTLLSLTGIPTTDSFYDERNRAIREAAEVIQRELSTGYANADLQRMSLKEILQPLIERPSARTLLSIASVFDGIFPRLALIQLAVAEGIATVEVDLHFLLKHRFLLEGDRGDRIWMSDRVRAKTYREQDSRERRQRHERAAAYFHRRDMTLDGVYHLQQAAQWRRAADLLLQKREKLRDEMQGAELRSVLALFPPGKLDVDSWFSIQVLRCDVCSAAGETDMAIESCRQALREVGDPNRQAQLFRRLGKLYEQRNQAHALNYYAQAEERFAPDSPELLTLLKDRGWLFVLRREWMAAEADIRRGLALVNPANSAQHADLLDALAGLHRNRGEYDMAICHAQQALALREELGDLLRVAKSLGNLGLMYNNIGDYDHAIAAHREALAVYRKLGNHELWATALLNIGLAHHMSGNRIAAVQSYQESLRLCRRINLPLAEIRVLANLAEALAELERIDEAHQAWCQGIDLARLHSFDDEVAYYAELRARFPALGGADMIVGSAAGAQDNGATMGFTVDLSGATQQVEAFENRIALELAFSEGRITARRFMEAATISKATATRRLAELVHKGALLRVGQGRGTYYVSAMANPQQPEPQTNAAQIARLYTLREELLARDGISSLGIVGAGSQTDRLELLVRFTALPDLIGFFHIKQRLSAALGQTVDLIPDAYLTEQQQIERWQTTQLLW